MDVSKAAQSAMNGLVEGHDGFFSRKEKREEKKNSLGAVEVV